MDDTEEGRYVQSELPYAAHSFDGFGFDRSS